MIVANCISMAEPILLIRKQCDDRGRYVTVHIANQSEFVENLANSILQTFLSPDHQGSTNRNLIIRTNRGLAVFVAKALGLHACIQPLHQEKFSWGPQAENV